jgi:hypothetical protein
MEDKEIKIKIDPNGNIHREVVDQSETKDRKPKLFQRLVSSLPI